MNYAVRVLVPDMPTTDELLPFLREMDRAKVYCNNGPLVSALEHTVGVMMGCSFSGAGVCAVSSGTAALELALKALGLPRGTPVAVPGLTFRATAQAAVNAGLVPVFCDVDRAHFHMHPHALPEGVDVALPVATYGVALQIGEWEAWASRYPERRVVMDCAGSFGDQHTPRSAQVSACFSLHTTKFIGAGEGGLVYGPANVVEAVRQLACFGDARGASNCRMSEYHAAVGLASLQLANRKALRLSWLAQAYWHQLGRYCPEVVSLRSQTLGSCSSLFVVELPDVPDANAKVGGMLRDAGVETRLWYRPFPQELVSLTSPQDMPPGAARAANRHLGLPFHTFMDDGDVALVCRELSSALSKLL